MQTILFTDTVCPQPYDSNDLRTKALGGSQATLIRIAESLATLSARTHRVFVHEHNRQTPSLCDRVLYITSLDDMSAYADPESVVHQRRLNPEALDRYPNARHFLWLHDLAHDLMIKDTGHFVRYFNLNGRRITIICVSKWHKKYMQDHFECDAVKYKTIYNPVMPIWYDLGRKITNYSKTTLCFTSSPHKGLDVTIQLLDMICKNTGIDFELLVANPNYIELNGINHKRVKFLGALPHEKLLPAISHSMAHLFIQGSWQETFGLVYPEANVLGIPSITLNIGAASETSQGVLLDPPTSLTLPHLQSLADRISPVLKAWHDSGRPKVHANIKFRLDHVLMGWMKSLRLKL